MCKFYFKKALNLYIIGAAVSLYIAVNFKIKNWAYFKETNLIISTLKEGATKIYSINQIVMPQLQRSR